MIQRPNHTRTFKVGIGLIAFGFVIIVIFGIPPLSEVNQSIQNPRCNYELACFEDQGGELLIVRDTKSGNTTIATDYVNGMIQYVLVSDEVFAVTNPIFIYVDLHIDNPELYNKTYVLITMQEEDYTISDLITPDVISWYRDRGLVVDLNTILPKDKTNMPTNRTTFHGEKVWTPESENNYVLMAVIELKDGSMHPFPSNHPLPVQAASIIVIL